jgi:hypothetical protein
MHTPCLLGAESDGWARRNILEMMMMMMRQCGQRKTREIALELTDEQCARLNQGR